MYALSVFALALQLLPSFELAPQPPLPPTVEFARRPLALTLTGGQRWGHWGSRAYAQLSLHLDLPDWFSQATPELLLPKVRPLPEPARVDWLTVDQADHLLAAALRTSEAARAKTRLSDLAARARYAAAVPEVRLRAGSSADESLRLSPTLGDPAHYSQNGSRDLWFDAQLSWRLDRAIFSKEELVVERLRRAREQDRQQLVARVLSALGNWQKAQIRQLEPLLLPEERRRAQLRAISAASLLNALTDGWFSRHLPSIR